MTLTITLGHVIALMAGGVLATVMTAIVASRRITDARAEAKIARNWGDSHGLRLDSVHVSHEESMRLNTQIQSLLRKQAQDSRAIAALERACNEQLRDEISTLNQVVSGAGEKLAGLNNELADWTAFGLKLRGGMDLGSDDVLDLEWVEEELRRLLLDSPPQFTVLEEISSDKEAGSEDETRELNAVEA